MTQKRNFQVFCIPAEELMDDPDKESHVVIPNVDEATKSAIADARIQLKALKWDEAKCERANRRFDSGK